MNTCCAVLPVEANPVALGILAHLQQPEDVARGVAPCRSKEGDVGRRNDRCVVCDASAVHRSAGVVSSASVWVSPLQNGQRHLPPRERTRVPCWCQETMTGHSPSKAVKSRPLTEQVRPLILRTHQVPPPQIKLHSRSIVSAWFPTIFYPKHVG